MDGPAQLAAAPQNIEARQTLSPAPRIVLIVAIVALLLVCAVRTVVSWRHDANMDHVSGVWTTMAQDLLHGVFYRPVAGPLGYGGTRYMPVFFTLQALFWNIFDSWRTAGRLICGGSIVALVGGVYLLLRRFQIHRALAFGAACLFLAGAGGKYALLDMRADGLAAALNLWGVIAATYTLQASVGPYGAIGTPSKWRAQAAMFAASILFTFAFATKITTVFGVAAVVLWLFFSDRRRTAVICAVATGGGYLLVIALTNFFSGGRFLQIVRATASGGGSNGFALTAPVRLADELTQSAPDAVLVVCAFVVLFSLGSRMWRTLPGLFFVTTFLVTLVIFGSPGTVGNHLVDLEVVSAIVIAFGVSAQLESFGTQARSAIALSAVCYLFAGIMVVATLHYWQEFKDEDTEPMRDNYGRIEEAVRATGKPVLCENPIIAIESGQRPYVLDPFMFRVFAARDPQLAQSLWNKLDQKAFGAVVLEYDPRGSEGTYVYESIHFGPPFSEHLLANYEFVKQVGDLYVWKPEGANFPALEE